MPLSDIPGIPQDADLPRVVDYLIMIRRKLNDFLNHLDSLNIEELTADRINTGTLNANLVSVSAANGGKSFTIDTTGIKANNGTTNTLQFDLATGLLTIVSALIQSASGYPRIELNDSNLLSIYLDATHSIVINTNASGSPSITFNNPGGAGLIAMSANDTGTFNVNSSQQMIVSSSQSSVNLNPFSSLLINGTAGYSGTISYVKDVVGTTVYYGSITVTKGIITSVT